MADHQDQYDDSTAEPQEEEYTNGHASPSAQPASLSEAAPGSPPPPPAPAPAAKAALARKKLMGYVGFANLPNQVHRKRSVPFSSFCLGLRRGRRGKEEGKGEMERRRVF